MKKLRPSSIQILKLNYRKTVFYFALNFLPWDFLSVKMLEIEKTKATFITGASENALERVQRVHEPQIFGTSPFAPAEFEASKAPSK